MMEELTIVTVHNKICHICKSGSNELDHIGKSHRLPVFYWGVGEEARESVEMVISYLKEKVPDANFILAAYESENWNDDYSPWAAPVVFGKEGFGGNAGDTLKWLTQYFIPHVEAKESEIARFPVGYSLAGLFSLWVYCECDGFAGAVSCSGSLWYEGWLDYVQNVAAKMCTNEAKYIYLSLGDKEEKTKNKLMSTVGDNTKQVYTMLCENQKNVQGVLEWNQGGHFSEPDLRVAKGIHWILRQFDV